MTEPQENGRPDIAALEALLFIHGEPMTYAKIATVLARSAEETHALVEDYRRALEEDGRGLMLVADGTKVQLATKPAFANIIEEFVKSELAEELSPASVETLAIVSYFGPISRSRIDYQRGVNSSFILRSLLIRGLIDRHPDPARPNSFLYEPSFTLLRHLGVPRASELPDYASYHDLLARFEAELEGREEGPAAAELVEGESPSP